MKKQLETKSEPKTDVKKDMTEIKVTLAIMQKEIAELEKKLNIKSTSMSDDDRREIFEMRNNNRG